MRPRARLAAAVAAAVLALAACGSSGEDISAAASSKLRPQVQRVREAVAANSGARVSASLDELRKLVEQQRAAGGLSDGRARDILDAADRLQQDFDTKASSPSPTPSSESPSPTPTPTTESPTPSPTPTTESPTPSPTPSVTVSVSVAPSTGVGAGTATSTPTSAAAAVVTETPTTTP